jgi:hypothetical protein
MIKFIFGSFLLVMLFFQFIAESKKGTLDLGTVLLAIYILFTI